MLCQKRWILGCLAIAMVLGAGRVAQAVTYSVDTALSYITIGGDGIGPQSGDSDTITFENTSYVTANRGTNTIEFTGGVLDAAEWGNVAPADDTGMGGTAAGDAGIEIGPFGLFGDAAIREFIATITSGVLTIDGNGDFDATGASDSTTVTLGVVSPNGGYVDFQLNFGLGFGSADLSGESGPNEDADGYVDEGMDEEEVGIDIFATFPIEIDEETSIEVELSGQLILYRSLVQLQAVPEPSSVALLLVGLAAVVPLSVRRLRRRGA